MGWFISSHKTEPDMGDPISKQLVQQNFQIFYIPLSFKFTLLNGKFLVYLPK